MVLFCGMILPIKLYLHWRIRRATNKKWKIILSRSNHAPLSDRLKREIVELWGRTLTSADLHQIAALIDISQNPSAGFVPEFQYYFSFEPAMNQRLFAAAYSDKNFYEKFLKYPSGLFVSSIIRSVNGVLMNGNFSPCSDSDVMENMITGVEYIFKPSTSTSGGSDVALIVKNDLGQIQFRQNQFNSFGEAMRSNGLRHANYLIQERVKQHEWFAKWNRSSLNTVRLMTYRSVRSNEVHHLGSVIRFGRSGSIVDNQAAGGLTCGIDDQGRSRSFVCDKHGRVEHDGFFGEMVPMHGSMVEIAKVIANQFPYHRFLGFDFCVNESGQVQLLEVNCKNIEINFMQMNNGPIMDKYLSEIISYSSRNHRQYLFEFHY